MSNEMMYQYLHSFTPNWRYFIIASQGHIISDFRLQVCDLERRLKVGLNIGILCWVVMMNIYVLVLFPGKRNERYQRKLE